MINLEKSSTQKSKHGLQIQQRRLGLQRFIELRKMKLVAIMRINFSRYLFTKTKEEMIFVFIENKQLDFSFLFLFPSKQIQYRCTKKREKKFKAYKMSSISSSDSVIMNLGTWSTGSNFAHFPKVILGISRKNSLSRKIPKR